MSANDYLRRPSCRRLVWVAFANLLTFIVPDIFLRHVVRLTTSGNSFSCSPYSYYCMLIILVLLLASRRAWREKVALFFSFIFLAALFCFWLEYVSLFFCDPQKPLEYSYVFSNESKYAAINGKAVNWTRYIGTSDIADFVSNNPHRDLSAMFPKFMLLDRSSSEGSYSDDILNQCIYNQNKSSQADAWLTHRLTKDPGYSYVNKQLVSCPLPGHPNITGAPCYFGEKTTSIVDGYAVKGGKFASISIYS